MGEIKTSLIEEQKGKLGRDHVAETGDATKLVTSESVSGKQDVSSGSYESAPKIRSDQVTLTLAPNEGAEIKVSLNRGQKVHYKWFSTGKVNFDNHGDSKRLNIRYHPYGKGMSQSQDEGVIEAAFDGTHGWFWRNRTKDTVEITLNTNGEYSKITRIE